MGALGSGSSSSLDLMKTVSLTAKVSFMTKGLDLTSAKRKPARRTRLTCELAVPACIFPKICRLDGEDGTKIPIEWIVLHYPLGLLIAFTLLLVFRKTCVVLYRK